MARSSRGEDARFSFWKQGFDSPTGYVTALQIKVKRFFCECRMHELKGVKTSEI